MGFMATVLTSEDARCNRYALDRVHSSQIDISTSGEPFGRNRDGPRLDQSGVMRQTRGKKR